MKMYKIALFVVFSLFLLLSTVVVEAGSMVIEEGKDVRFEYALKVEGEVVDSTKGKDPLQYTHGQGQIIPGLAKQMEGMQVGDSKVVTVGPKEAYGEVNPQAFKEVAKSSLPEGLELKVGMPLQAGSPGGKALIVTISEVKDDTVILDLNHPLAGKTLTFDIKIVSVK
ncbi:peptidylprolyl isomerase [Candidatus Omnitrophota bacterium]